MTYPIRRQSASVGGPHELFDGEQMNPRLESVVESGVDRCPWKTILAGLVVFLIGGFVLLGWLTANEFLKSLSPGWISMKANTAVGFLLGGLMLVGWAFAARSRSIRWLAFGVAVLLVLLGFANLLQFLLRWDLGIDEILFDDTNPSKRPAYPGRMSSISAWGFFLTGLAGGMALLRPSNQVAQVGSRALSFCVAAIGIVGMVDYGIDAFGDRASWNFTGLAVHTALAFLVLGLGMLLYEGPLGEPNHPLGQTAGWGIGVGFALILVITLTTYHATWAVQDGMVTVTKRHQIIAITERVARKMESSMGNFRAFLGSGNDAYLAQREIAIQAAHRELEALRRAMDDESGSLLLDQLENAWRNRLESTANVLMQFRSGDEVGVRSYLANDLFEPSRLEIERCLAQIRDGQVELLNQNIRELDELTTDHLLLLPLGAFASIALLVVALSVLNLQIEISHRSALSLSKSEKRMETILANLSEGLVVGNQSLEVIHFNQAGRRMFGLNSTAEALRALPDFADTFVIRDPDDNILPVEKWPLSRALAGDAFRNQEFRITHIQQGWTNYYSFNGCRVENPAEEGWFAIVTIADITERKMAEKAILELNTDLERRVGERTRALQVSNRELDAFCYSVSHDLRAPLRAISGFSSLLSESLGERLDNTQRNYFERVIAATRRMSQLIDDLLALSRLSREALAITDVDVTALAGEVVEGLHSQEPERAIKCHIAPGLATRADPRMVRIVLENLLGNAWKFTAKAEDAVISLEEARHNGRRVFVVKDNGAGFDARYAAKLFTPFQRLHTPDEFPGSGIGLAIVQRIINRHEGLLEAEGSVGRGASFFFSFEPFRT